MNRHERIISLLTQEFTPISLEVTDDSAKHAGHSGARPGGETHYDVVIVSEKFKGLSKVARHQAVYKVLDGELKGGLHALAMKTLAPGE